MKNLVLALAILLAACGTTPSDSAEPPPQPEQPPLPDSETQEIQDGQETTASTDEAESQDRPVENDSNIEYLPYPPSELSPMGPWLVYYDEYMQVVFATNQDGSGKTKLDVPLTSSVTQIAGSPSGRFFAYIDGDDSHSNPDLDMVIVELPSGQVFDRIPLIEPDWHEKDLPTGVENEELYLADVMQSIGGRGSYEWSSDGRSLAYVGATIGPSGDVHVYDTVNKDIFRLTAGSGQAAKFSWSPNDEWIAHLVINTFCCGAGRNVESLWVVNPSGTEVEDVTSGGNIYFILGWLGDQSFIMTSWSALYELGYLWIDDIRDKETTMFFEGPLRMPTLDTAGSVVALYLEEYDADLRGVEPEIYLQPRNNAEPILVQASEYPLSIRFSDHADLFIAGLPDETILFDRQGNVVERIPVGGRAIVSPDGKWIAIYKSGDGSEPGIQLYSFDDNLLSSLTEIPVYDLFWGIDSGGIFVSPEHRGFLYIPIETDEIFIVDDIVSHFSGEMTWVGDSQLGRYPRSNCFDCTDKSQAISSHPEIRSKVDGV